MSALFDRCTAPAEGIGGAEETQLLRVVPGLRP